MGVMTYKQKYLNHFGYGEQEFVPCEICNNESVDVHHLIYRSHGGTDDIENLMALCRRCHIEKAHKNKVHYQVFKARHEMFLTNFRNYGSNRNST